MITAEYPPAICVPADPSNYRAVRGNAVKLIVIHCTDGRERAQPVAEMWRKPGHGSSAHFVIGQDGTVIQAVPLAAVAWHAHAANGISVGIEHCARTPGEFDPKDPGLRPSQVQYEASAKLVAWLCRRFKLELSREVVLGHAEADGKTTHTRCPDGCGWDWDAYMVLVAKAVEEWTRAS